MARGKTARRQALDRRRTRLTAQRDSAEKGDVFGLSLGMNGRYRRAEVRWLIDADPMIALMGLNALRAELLAPLEADLVLAGRRAGLSWDDLGWCVGLTRTAMMKRHPDADREAFAEPLRPRPVRRRQAESEREGVDYLDLDGGAE